jgi:hypothetical protein
LAAALSQVNLGQFKHGARIVDMGHDRQPAEVGDNLAEQFEALASKIGRLER